MKNDIQKLTESFGENSRIGDVLEKIGFNWAKKAVDEHLHNTVWILEKAQNDLLKLWNPCGFTKSLQQIFSEAEWEEDSKCGACGEWMNQNPCSIMSGREDPMPHKPEPFIHSFPKQPHIRELFQFLLQLGL